MSMGVFVSVGECLAMITGDVGNQFKVCVIESNDLRIPYQVVGVLVM